MSHRNKIVLTTDTADHAPVVEAVGHRSAIERHHHRGIDEAGIAALQRTQRKVVTVELVDEAHAAHIELRAIALRHVSERGVETARSEEKPRMQHVAVAQLATETVLCECKACRSIAKVGGQPVAPPVSGCGPFRSDSPGGTRRGIAAWRILRPVSFGPMPT